MKICIIGSHSTGKTTLCELLSKKYPNHFIIPEIARVFGVEKIIPKSIKLQIDMMMVQINIEKYHKNFISDRSVLDFGVYSEDSGLIKYCKGYTNQSYDYIFYLPVTFLPVDDGFRNIDREYQIHIADLFEQHLPEKTIILSQKPISDRIVEITNIIKE